MPVPVVTDHAGTSEASTEPFQTFFSRRRESAWLGRAREGFLSTGARCLIPEASPPRPQRGWKPLAQALVSRGRPVEASQHRGPTMGRSLPAVPGEGGARSVGGLRQVPRRVGGPRKADLALPDHGALRSSTAPAPPAWGSALEAVYMSRSLGWEPSARCPNNPKSPSQPCHHKLPPPAGTHCFPLTRGYTGATDPKSSRRHGPEFRLPRAPFPPASLSSDVLSIGSPLLS